LVLYAANANAEVEWFTKGQISELLVDTMAQVISGDSRVNCTFAKTNEPACVSGPCKQHETLCTPRVLSWSNLSPSATFRETAEAKPPPYKKDQGTHHVDMSMASIANQETLFGSLGMSSKNSIASNRVNRGNWTVGTHGHAQSSGDVYFRISGMEAVPYELKGRILPIGVINAHLGRGMLELIGIKTSGLYDPINISSYDAKSTNLAQTGQLSPGDYRLHWYIVNDVTNSSGAASLNFDLTFGSVDQIEVCPDDFVSPTPRWPPRPNYTATVEEDVDYTGEERYSPKCEEKQVCWKQKEVRFYLKKPGEERKGPYTGWRYIPGTLRRAPNYELPCSEIDPRYSCHGYIFAESRFWLDAEDTSDILDDWCTEIAGPASGGTVRIYVKKMTCLQTEDGTPLLECDEPAHSQILPSPGQVDEKLGVLRYQSELPYKWDKGGMERYYRCNF
jgi:hypothetical protein